MVYCILDYNVSDEKCTNILILIFQKVMHYFPLVAFFPPATSTPAPVLKHDPTDVCTKCSGQLESKHWALGVVHLKALSYWVSPHASAT